MSPEALLVAACRVTVLAAVSAAGAAWYHWLTAVGYDHQSWLADDEPAHKAAAVVWALHLTVAAALIVAPLAVIIWRAVS